jgi:hypothetical protein
MVGMSGHYILDVPAPKVAQCHLMWPSATPRCASRVSVPYIDTMSYQFAWLVA